MRRHGPQSTKRSIGAPSCQPAFQPDRRRPAMKVWALLGAHHGDNNQVLALAEGLGLQFERKYLHYNRWRHLGPHLLGSTFLSLTRESRRAAVGPLPDLTISTGHRSVPVVRALRKRSHGKLRTIHVGYPRISPNHFDLVVTTPEFPIADHQNLLRIPYALTRPPIREAADDPFWSAHPSPRALLIVGGPALYWRLDRAEISNAIAHAIERAAIQGGSVLVVGSPRTPDALLGQLQGQLEEASVPATLVPTRGPPDYRALLAQADTIVVTAESVAMVSEAIATGKPVSLIPVRSTMLGRMMMTLTDMVLPGRRVPPRDLRFFWDLLHENRLVGPGRSRRRPLPDPADLVATRVNAILVADTVAQSREHSL